MSAMEDAFRDIQTDDPNLIKCYFGSAYIYNDDEKTAVGGVNLLIRNCSSYEEAVGMAYLDLKSQFPISDGFEIRNLELETIPVFADSDSYESWMS